MGTRGPVPKRPDQRRRTNSSPADGPKAPASSTAKPPPAKGTWHAVAKRWYKALAESGQAEFYEPSDWATAYLIAESMSRDLSPQVVGTTPGGKILRDTIPLKGASLSAYLKAMGSLLVTEGDRRRAQVELQKPQPVDPDAERAGATVTDLRSRLSG